MDSEKYIPLEYDEGTPGHPYLKIVNDAEKGYIYQIVHKEGDEIHVIDQYLTEFSIQDEDIAFKAVMDRKFSDASIKTSAESLKSIQPVEFSEEIYELKQVRLDAGVRREFIFHPKDLAIYINRYKENDETGQEVLVDKKKFIDAYPKKITINQSPLNRLTTYKVEWKAKRALYTFETEGSPTFIIADLKKQGYLLNSYNAEDNFSLLLSEAHKEGIVKTDYKMDKPGFFYFDGDITPSMYEMTPPTPDDIMGALTILEQFADSFSDGKVEKDQRDKIASTIKLGLTLPFNYVRKKLGYSEVIKPPLAYGKPGSGKTTINLLPAYLYGQSIDDYERAGSNIMTPPRFAEVMGESTFPTLIDEAGNVFDSKELMEVNKTGLRREWVRNKLTKEGQKILEPAYSTFIYISNYPPIKDSNDGTVRRYHIYHYEELEYKDESNENVKTFNREFKPRDPDSPLLRLESLGRFAAAYIIRNQKILGKEMMDAGREILYEMYNYAGMDAPEWIKWEAEAESIEDFGEHEKEIILSHIRGEVMRAYRDKILVDDGSFGKREKLVNYDDDDSQEKMKDRYYQVAKEGIVPWLFYKERAGSFFIRSTFRDDLARTKNLNLSLKSIAQKFEGWKYVPYRDPQREDKKPVRMIRIEDEAFYDSMID